VLEVNKNHDLRMNTMKEKCLLKNDDGSVLVLALVMLVLLTLLGISASRTSSIEIQISGNDMIYKQNLYMAEAGAMEAVQELENNDLETNAPAWLQPIDTVLDIPDKSFWDANSEASGDPDLDDYTLKIASTDGIVGGASLDMSKSNVNGYTVYGRCERKKGIIVVEVGYRKPF